MIRPLQTIATLAVAISSTGSLACARTPPPVGVAEVAAQASPRVATAKAAPAARHVYRLDYLVKITEGSSATVAAYSLGLEEGRSGEVRTGVNVPLQRGATGSLRQDVGVVVRSSYNVAGDDLILHASVETSAADDLPAIRKLSTSGDVVVVPGTPALVASVDDPSGRVKYTVEVTATKLR